MPTIAEQLTQLQDVKTAIAASITSKGVTTSNTEAFTNYAGHIDSITGGGGTYQSKTVTPDASGQTVTPDAGFDALTQVVINGDADLTAANVKKDVNIFGTVGTYEGSTAADYNTLTANGTNYNYAAYQKTGISTGSLPNSGASTTFLRTFYGCSSMTSATINTTSCLSLREAFYSCVSLSSITFTGGTGSVTNMNSAFRYCSSLNNLTVDMNSCTDTTTMIGNVSSVFTTMYMSNLGVTLTYVPNSTNYASLMFLINGLKTVTGQTLSLAATNLAKLTPAEIAIATGKGWTVN